MERGQGSWGPGRIEVFQYPVSPHAAAIPTWNGWMEPTEAAELRAPEFDSATDGSATAAGLEFERRLAEETRLSFEAGRERGRQEGSQAARAEQAAAQKALEERYLRQGAELVEKFAEEHERYLHAVEHEVVKLALAVAARIMRREAMMDPLLLTGAVRVALGQLSGSGEVRLKVPLGELDLWTDAIAHLPNLALKPAVIAGEGMRLGECEIETTFGTVDLGIRSQLLELERGFFDGARATKSVTHSGQDLAVAGSRESQR